MRYLLKASGMVAATAFATFAPGAVAQEVLKFSCQAVGGSGAPEPLGDREGHNITVLTASCRNVGGVLDGSLTTSARRRRTRGWQPLSRAKTQEVLHKTPPIGALRFELAILGPQIFVKEPTIRAAS